MPYRNREKRLRVHRSSERTRRHGNWRQVYLDCGGLCQKKDEVGVVCGEVDFLEFHETFGEDKRGDGRFQQRLLLCHEHHSDEHGGFGWGVRYFPSMLAADVAAEMAEAGGLAGWIIKNKLKEKGE